MRFFTGLDAEAYDRTYTDLQLIQRMIGYFKPHARRITGVVAGLMVISSAHASAPILVAEGVNLMTHAPSPALLVGMAFVLLALGVIAWAANWFSRRLTMRAVGDVMLNLRQEAFNAAAAHDLSFYDEFSSGRVVSRITSDSEEFAQVVVLVTDLVSQIIEAGILLIVLAFVELRLVPWVLIMMPVVFLVAIGFRRLARIVTTRGMRAMANVNAEIKEAITGISVAKGFRQELAIYREFDAVNRQSYRINIRRGFVLSIVFPTLNALGGIGTALLVYVGGLNVAGALITFGAWYLFINSLDRFWFPMLNLSAFWSQVQSGLSAAERVFALIDAESAVTQIDRQPVSGLRGAITFDHLGFRYQPNEPVLQDFQLEIAPGENLALVGHTGAGKSSIAKLIARFYEFQDGKLLIDGLDIRTLELRQYRRQLGIVSQAPFLFSGSVLDNIRYARPDAPESEIAQLAGRIGGGEWVELLPAGLATEVGERGSRLSMGQRQLVSLMRVLVQRPAIFILDEATANIDPFTEAQIEEAVSLILAETTSILIAHRLSTVKAADRIIVLRQGKIIEEGDHLSLMSQGGHYAELYNTYFRHQSLEYIENVRQAAFGD